MGQSSAMLTINPFCKLRWIRGGRRWGMRNFIDTVQSRSDMIMDAFLQHILLSFTALIIGLAIALPVGMMVARYRRFAEPIIGVAAVLQTIPSLALFGILVPLIGIGSKTALIALVI